VRDACAELATIGAETIQHDDLHDGNVHRPDAGYRILDWGDAGVSHPFATLLVTERSVAARFGLEVGMPELARLRAAYLEPWTDVASSSVLRHAAELAIWVGLISRALTWRDALSVANDDELAEWEGYPADTLRVLTEPSG
jgi:aminoglycoside phosphotransferase (APT) family kinase protein